MANSIKLNYRVKGAAQLKAKLDNMSRRVSGKLMTEAVKTAMEPVKNLAISRAPVDSGLLRRSIKIGVAKSRYLKGAVVRTGTRRQLNIPDDAKYYYPAALEYGTKHIVARSFLRSSLADRKSQALNILEREINRLLLTAK